MDTYTRPPPIPPPRRALGKTGLVLPVIGFGVSGPLALPVVSQEQARALIASAIAQGVEVFDTAPFYGAGEGERRLAQALVDPQTRGARSFVITKGGTLRRGRRTFKDFTPDGLRAQLLDSLSRLPHADAFFLHGPAPEHLTPAVFSALEEMRREGLFRFLGVAGRGMELDIALQSGVFDLVMAPAHNRLPDTDLERLEQARADGLGVIGIETLAPAARGLRLSLRPADLWYSARALIRRRGAAPAPQSPEDCIHWALNSGLVDIALVTTTRLSHLTQNIAAARGAS